MASDQILAHVIDNRKKKVKVAICDFTKKSQLIIGLLSRRMVVLGVQVWVSWAKIYGEFEYRIGSALSGRNSELPIENGILFWLHSYLLRIVTANPMQNSNSTQNFGPCTYTSAYVGNVRRS